MGDSPKRAGRFLVLHARDRDDRDDVRLAVVASRRVGPAVARNRSKRLLREAARHTPWRTGLDLVVVARGSAASAQLAEVQNDLLAVAERLELLEDPT